MTLDLEEWRSVDGCPGYEVSNLGRSRSWRPIRRHAGAPSSPRILKPTTNSNGYLRVRVRDEHGRFRSMYVHRLVLLAFRGPCPDGMEACHGPDHAKSNCRLDNLKWDTRKSNLEERDARLRLSSPTSHDPLGLTQRERLTAALFSTGQTSPSVAIAMGVKTCTAKQFLKTLYRKLGIHTRAELVVVLRGPGSSQ
jgi:DNA-binding CsgD family transcriptional regulator